MSSQKVPLVNAHFALFPVSRPESSAWLNPLSIFQVTESHGLCVIQLTNGLTLEIPMGKQSLLRLACKAVYSLATYRQDYSLQLLTNGQPLHYVSLPDTPLWQKLEPAKVFAAVAVNPWRICEPIQV